MKNLKISVSIFLLASMLMLNSSCRKEEPNNNSGLDGEYSTGWFGDEDNSTVPVTPNLDNNENLPSSINLLPHFPQIGDQGNFGTCVAWAVGYNGKTAVNAIDNGLFTADLNASNVFSPKDLFTAIPDNQKGGECNGTLFSPALEVMQQRGIANLSTVPYNNLGGCFQNTLESSWNANAANNKIDYWRRVDFSLSAIKTHIADKQPVAIGCSIPQSFMTWSSDDVMTSGSGVNNGQHAGHALIIAGYDDNQGPNGAFRVVNSWGNLWGDNGYVWIDYNYMMTELITDFGNGPSIYIMNNAGGNSNPPDEENTNSNGVDLAPWIYADYPSSYYDRERVIEFNVFNVGSQTANASDQWLNVYAYFNAYDANDYGVIFVDAFDTSIPSGTVECPYTDNCIFNINIPANDNLGNAWGGYYGVQRPYVMPDVTGDYYLVMLTDLEDKFGEDDEINNVFYTTVDPIWFENGNGFNGDDDTRSAQFTMENRDKVSSADIKSSTHSSIVTDQFLNAYRPEEITAFFTAEKRSGRLDAKIRAYQNESQSNISPLTELK